MPTRAILFDFGHTLVDYVPAEPFLLETYQAIRRQLAEELSAEVPSAEALVKAISNRIGEEIGQSYQKNEIEELDLVALYRDAFAALDLPLAEERLQEFL